ncbi:hypothetical protein [Methyloversatilis thermotolerans]|uniref:hypothetical protein n=1 Tax=Methyloversatilis thermotolerans TaxID=1346290 RepID=UPI001E557FB1|nr:hypothetical protein [Methyloversatilis thermotolerans]
MGKTSVALRRARYETLRDARLQASPKGVAGYGYKVFSQSDEDGVINQIFRRIGLTNRIFVEFGVGDGLENNTAALLFDGWSGLWIEGSKAYSDRIISNMSNLIDAGRLKVVNDFVYPDNIDRLISSNLEVEEIDLLSVDIDGNDAHVVKEIKCINPRVIVVEYNAKFGPSIDFCMKYDRNHVWRKSDNFGASLKNYEKLMSMRGYSLVGCNVVGTNAFFVRSDLVGELFDQPYTSEHHYEPARYELVGLPAGHPAIHSTFQSIL